MIKIKFKELKTAISSKKYIITFLTLVIFLTLFSSAVYSANITDLAGREVELPEKIEKIAAVGPGALRLVVYLEAEKMVVGIEEFERRDQKKPYILANPELAELPVIGPQFGGDPELIAAADPDIVFASYLSEEELNNLSKKTGIPVLSINDGSAGSMTEKELFAALDFMAPLLKKEGRSAELKEIFLNYKEDLISRAAELETRLNYKSYYIGGIGKRGAQGLTSTEAAYPPFEYLALKNIIEAEEKKNFTINKEELLIRDPDIIFVDQGGKELVINDLNREEFSYLKAYRNNDIYELLPYNYYTTNFATMFADAYFIGEVIFSGDFIEESASAKADQIYKSFLGRGVYKEMADIFGGFSRLEID
jgi:iron complex transport system substrate-binding protein